MCRDTDMLEEERERGDFLYGLNVDRDRRAHKTDSAIEKKSTYRGREGRLLPL